MARTLGRVGAALLIQGAAHAAHGDADALVHGMVLGAVVLLATSAALVGAAAVWLVCQRTPEDGWPTMAEHGPEDSREPALHAPAEWSRIESVASLPERGR